MEARRTLHCGGADVTTQVEYIGLDVHKGGERQVHALLEASWKGLE
jgi:hypothetical protein